MATAAGREPVTIQYDDVMTAIRLELRYHTRLLAEHTRQLNWLMTAMVDLMTYVGVDAPPRPAEPDEEG